MSKVVFRKALSRSLLQKPLPHSFKIITNHFSTEEETLPGLIDPNFHYPENNTLPSQRPKSQSFSPQEFTFLKGTLTNTSKVDTFDLGKSPKNDCFFIIDGIKDINDGFKEKTQKFLRQFREKLNEKLVVEVLKNVKNSELGVKFFLWAGKQIGYSHSLAVYDALLDLLSGGRIDNKLPEIFLKEINDNDKDILRKLLNVMVQKCCRNGLWNLALEELHRLKNFGYRPSRASYNDLVMLFLNINKFETAVLLHKEMSDKGYKLDEQTLNCYVYHLCKVGEWREAIELIRTDNIIPNTLIYTSMIKGLCEASLFEVAMDFLEQMRTYSCIPNNSTYDVLLRGCLNKNKLGRCKRILSMMILEGCYPSREMFNSLVHGFCKSNDYSYAYKLFKKMSECGYKPGYVPYNILIGGICGNEELPGPNDMELAENVYNQMLNEKVLLNKVNVSNLARCLCAVEKYEKAFNIIREMMSKGFKPDASTYCKVIEFLCNASKVDKAFLLFNEMKKNGISPDVYIYTVLIDNFSKAGLIEQARAWFDEMVRYKCSPNVVTYTTLIHAYLKARKINEANELFELMLDKKCSPNIVTFTALIDGFCKARDVDKACQIYAKMKGTQNVNEVDKYFRITKNGSVEPNVITYGALVDGLCKVHRVKEARDLLNVMSSEGSEPNIIIHDALIDGFCKVGKLDEAQEVFAKMSERGYDPSVYTYSSLIDRLFKNKRLDLALKVLSKMLENSCPPNVVIYTEMIDGLCKVGKTDEAFKLMVMMEEKDCIPNVVTYTAMIDGFARAGKLNKSIELFEIMSSKGCVPNYVTYSVLIHHCCAMERLDEAYKYLEEMKRTHWPRNVASYRKVIKGFSREFITSLGLLDGVSGNNSLVPIVSVYRVLIDTFRKAGKLEIALELHKEISSSSSSSYFSLKDKRVYSCLIESLAFSGKVDEAFELYVEMIKKGGVPELSVFVNLVKGLVMVNRWEDAFQLSESLCFMDICWVNGENVSDGS